MPRKLKTYETSVGFYDLAVAAPSMKAALEAWGAGSNLFHQGIAKETDNPDGVAAAMAAPGVVLRRPVGSTGPFKENADLPANIERGGGAKKAGRRPMKQPLAKRPEKQAEDPEAERKAASAYQREEKRREREREREEAARQREHERRQKAVDKAQSALEAAAEKHERNTANIRAEIEALENRLQAEDERWHKEKTRLETALRRPRE
jgi:hypothetical protein